jgi:outer membrane protein TolC
MQTNSRWILPIALAIVAGFLQAAPVRAEDPAGAPAAATTIDLGIKDVVVKALEANLDIEVERYNPEIASADIMTEMGAFDPIFRLEYSYEESESPQTTTEGLATDAGTTETVRKDVTLAVEGKLTTGTEYGIAFDRVQSQFTQRDVFIDPDPLVPGDEFFDDVQNPGEYNLDLTFTLTQPLLKDFGRGVNTTDVRVARTAREMSVEEFSKRVMDVIAEAQSAYWNLAAAIRNVQVSEQSLATAENLLKENRIRLEVGTMAPLEVLQAEAGVAQREEEVIVAHSFVKDAEDNLKRILNLPKDTEEWKTGINPTDIPDIVEKDIDLLTELEKAFEKRPDYQKSLMQVESDVINERFTKNQLLPTVDANGELQYLAVDSDFEDAFDSITDRDARSWQLGLTAEYPVGNRTAKGEHRKAQLERQQSEKESDNLHLSIIVEVNKAVRDIRTSLKRLEVTAKSVELAEESLKAERKKLEVGVSTSHDVLEFEEELADAQRRRILAGLDYAKALVNLSLATGSLLEENDIVIAESL